MKKFSKILALLTALCMLFSIGVFAASAEPSAETGDASGEASAEEAATPTATGKTAEEAYVDYIHEWLLAELEVNSSMTLEQIEDEFMPLIEAGDYVTFPAEMLYSGMLNSGIAMTFEEFSAQYVPETTAAATTGKTAEEAYVDYIHEWLLAELEVNSSMTLEQIEDEFMPLIEAGDYVTFPAEMLYGGMLNSGIAMTFEEFAAQYVPETTAAATTGKTAEEAYVDYIHEWLLAELEVNSSMTLEQIEDEFMPLIEAGDYVTFPAEMLYGGMLNSGIAMTFEEFAAQYVPETTAAPAAGGDTSEKAYQTYLKSYVDAVPAVSDEQYAEFAALIDAGDYTSFPVEMCFTDTYWGFVAATYDEFVAAGGNVELPAFDPTLTQDAEA